MSSDAGISLRRGYLWISPIPGIKTASAELRQFRSLEEPDHDVFKQWAMPGSYGPAACFGVEHVKWLVISGAGNFLKQNTNGEDVLG